MGIQIVDRKDFEKKPHPSDRKFAKNIRIKKNKVGKEAANLKFCAKPWGFESLSLRNRHFDIWELSINPRSSTSSHIHTKKDSLMIVIRGMVILATTNEKSHLMIGDFRLSKHGATHQIINVTNKPARVLEIESPPDRNDLLRIRDSYGREGLPYFFGHNQPRHKKPRVVSKPFFQEAQKENAYFDFFELTSSSKRQKSLQIFGIACRKEVSPKDAQGLALLQKQVMTCSGHSFLVLGGNISVQGKRSTLETRKRGDCFTLPDASKIIRLSRNTVLIGWE